MCHWFSSERATDFPSATSLPLQLPARLPATPQQGRFHEDVEDYAAGAQDLYHVGTRLFTVSLSAPDFDLGPVRDLVAWRDALRR